MAGDIDAYLETMRMETQLLILNRADAIRQILAIGLQKIEADGRRCEEAARRLAAWLPVDYIEI